MNGYIQLHRKLLDSAVFQNEKLLKLFIHCLLKASYKERETLIGDSIVHLEQGQFVTGRKALSSELNLSEQQLRTLLKKLEKLNIISVKPTNRFSVVTVINWGLYQDANQLANQQSTNNQPTVNQQSTTNNKVNKDNKVNKRDSDKPKFVFKRAVIDLGVDAETASHWMTVRKNKKAANTELALKQVINQSTKANITPAEAIKFAAHEGWASFKAEWFFNSRNSTGTNQPKKTQGTLDDLDNYAEDLLL